MNYKLEEEYTDDPHWNSGFWETKVSFSDGTKLLCLGRKSELSDSEILNRYKYAKFREFWNKNKEKYKELAYKDFESSFQI